MVFFFYFNSEFIRNFLECGLQGGEDTTVSVSPELLISQCYLLDNPGFLFFYNASFTTV